MAAKNRLGPGVLSEAAKGTAAPPYAVSVGTTATRIVISNELRRVLTFFNNDSAKTLYVGVDNTVTTSNGYPLPFQQAFQDTRTEGEWWAVCSTGTIDVRVIEVSAN